MAIVYRQQEEARLAYQLAQAPKSRTRPGQKCPKFGNAPACLVCEFRSLHTDKCKLSMSSDSDPWSYGDRVRGHREKEPVVVA